MHHHSGHLTCSSPFIAQKKANQVGWDPKPNAAHAIPVLARPNDSSKRGDMVDPRKPLMPLEKAYATGSRLVMPPMMVRFKPREGSWSMSGFTKLRQFLVK